MASLLVKAVLGPGQLVVNLLSAFGKDFVQAFHAFTPETFTKGLRTVLQVQDARARTRNIKVAFVLRWCLSLQGAVK